MKKEKSKEGLKTSGKASKGQGIKKPAKQKKQKSTNYIAQLPAGYIMGSNKILIPQNLNTKPISTNKLCVGISKASSDIKQLVEEIVAAFSKDAHVTQIELSIGFNADGKFLGIGFGGDASISVTITPNATEK